MNSKEKLDAVLASDLSHLMAVSYIVLCNNSVTDRYIEKNFGIPVHAWSSLLAVDTFPGIKAKEIRKIFPRPQNTISRAISLLESRELVRQEASPEDGREKMIYITPEGQAVLKDIRQVSVERQTEIFEPLSARELKTFTQLALKIANGPALKDSRIMRRGE